MKIETAELITRELLIARHLFPRMNSAHEGWAILKEEVDELWDEVKKNPQTRAISKMKKEAIQVAAMAARFIEDCCNE
jgi:glutamyl-tRNA reductase